ncbi:MFS transporter [soil metagenome]
MSGAPTGEASKGHASALALLGQQRIAALFWVQFLGATNDNVFKFSFTLLATYAAATWGGLDPNLSGFVIGALFILPYLLFSATSGQIADKLEKSRLIRLVKNAEIVIMLIAAAGFLHEQAWLLYSCVFLMGLHSTVFGPVKYAYLPQHLAPRELTAGNGLVEMGTFVAILAGTVVGGLLIASGPHRTHWVAATVVLLAVAGRLAAGLVPHSPAADPSLRINFNPLVETIANLRLAHRRRAVFNSLLGISWLWFFGSVFLTSFTPFTRSVLHGDETLVTFLLTLFSVGVGVGSLLCARLSQGRIEIGLVPLGSIGMTLFAVDLYLAASAYLTPAEVGVAGFLSHWAGVRIAIDLVLLSLSCGLYSVPLYALIQARSDKTHTARIIAANNILNAVFMIVASVLAGALLASGFTIVDLFLFTALLNMVVAIYIYRLVPEFLLRFMAWVLVNTLYRIRAIDTERIPEQGAAVLVCNHVSFIDAIVIMGQSPRPVRFVMDHRIFKTPVLSWLFRQVGAIAIAPAAEDPAMLERAFELIDEALAEGELVCIFPEGRITRDGEVGTFKAGVTRILDRRPVPVIPMALRGVWGSFFSRFGGQAFSAPVDALMRRGFRARVELVVGEPVSPQVATTDLLRDRLTQLRGVHA